MFESRISGSGSISPWWVLLLLPIGLGVGWLVGLSPPSAPRPKAVAWLHDSPATTVSSTGWRVRPHAPATADENSELAPTGSAPGAPPATPESPRQELSAWTTLDGATSESQRNGKPILIDFNAEWCGPCQRMRSEVFDNASRGQSVQTAVIPVSIVDRQREDGSNPPDIASLQQRYQVDAFPTLIVYSPATGRSVKTRGFASAEATLQWINEAAKSVR